MGIFDKIKDFGSKIVRPAGPKIDWHKIVKPIGMPNPFAVNPGLKDKLKPINPLPTPDLTKYMNKPKNPDWKPPRPGIPNRGNTIKPTPELINKIRKGFLK